MRYAIMLAITLPALAALAQQDAADQPWERAYVGDEAMGPNVIALWQFDADGPTKDSSGNEHELSLRGEGRFVAEGKFGGGLESFPAGTENDKAQGAQVDNEPELSPAGAFTLEAWFSPKPEMDQYPRVFLLDKKNYFYASESPRANHDYCLYLTRVGENRRRIAAFLGYGQDSAQYTSSDVDVLPGEWYHVAFTYDGQGTGRFFLNGKRVGKTTHDGRGAISPGGYGLVIGDRYGSTHQGFPGFIDQVRLSSEVVPFFTGSLEIEVASGARCAFVRMEQNAGIGLEITNCTGKRLTGGTAQIVLAGLRDSVRLPDLEPEASHTVRVPVDTALRPGSYELTVAVSARDENRQYSAESAIPTAITPRPLPHQMPVVMWGGGDFERLTQIGFTHKLIHLVDYGKVWAAGEATEAAGPGQLDQHARALDDLLVHGMGGAVYVYPGRWVARNAKLLEQYRRVDRDGQPREKDNICATFPEVQQFAYNVGASVAKSFGEFPALQASLIHSEIRDGTDLCFHEHDREAFRKFAGYDIPDEIVSKNGVRYGTIPDFPRDRVLADDDRLLTFYRWFWKDGDGWNDLHTQTHRGLKSTGRDDLWTFFDPAVRVPSLWGSGGGVDVVSQWTYSYPDPPKIGQAADELFAMADGRPEQQVMKMTQVIWYRSQTAPKLPENEADRAQWEKDIPDARFITISPDHMREAFWSKISRPVRGIMYHGWGSLVQAGAGAYQYTNPKTKEVLAELVHKVVRPLGPTLLQVPDRQADVALLESFTSQMFAGRGTSGWGRGWEADAHLILQWAQIQPRILYEEAILRDGLDGFKVLVLAGCDVLTQSVVRHIAQFQGSGGIVVADEDVCPAIMPDILLRSYRRTGKPDEDKATLQARAAALRAELDDFYQRHADSSSPDVIVRCRGYGATDYLFTVNDKRTFGDYVGHHGIVMEKGLPNQATLSINHPGGHVYDLVSQKVVATQSEPGGLRFDADFGPGEGAVFMVTDRPIEGVRVSGPRRVARGAQVNLSVRVVDDSRDAIRAVVPTRVEVLDTEGRACEYSGYYGARDGLLALNLDIAQNDPVGQWTVRVTELASGRQAEHNVEVAQ